MTYAVLNAAVFSAAYAGAMGAMAASARVLLSTSSATYADLASTAGAWAESFDAVWAGASADVYQAQAIEELSAATWTDRTPVITSPFFPFARTNQFLLSATYTGQVRALVAAIAAGSSFLTSEGITLPSAAQQSVYVWRPGIASSGATLATWAEVAAVIALASGPLTILIDDTTAAAVVPAASGVTDCRQLARFAAMPGFVAGFRSMVLEDGAQLLDALEFHALDLVLQTTWPQPGAVRPNLGFSYPGGVSGVAFTGGCRIGMAVAVGQYSGCVIPTAVELQVTFVAQTGGSPRPTIVEMESAIAALFEIVDQGTLSIVTRGAMTMQNNAILSSGDDTPALAPAGVSFSYDSNFLPSGSDPLPTFANYDGSLRWTRQASALFLVSAVAAVAYQARSGECVQVAFAGADVDVTLPPDAASGAVVIIKSTAVEAVFIINVLPSPGFTIDGNAQDIIEPSTQKLSRMYVLNGASDWMIMGLLP